MNPNTERDERVATFKDWLTREDSGDVEQLERCWNRAATRMRDLCVARVKSMADEWQILWEKDLTGDESEKIVYVQAANQIILKLESLTLDQVEQEKQK